MDMVKAEAAIRNAVYKAIEAVGGVAGLKTTSMFPISSRKPAGLFALLTEEQKKAALAYDGPCDFGDPAFLMKNTRPTYVPNLQ